MRGDRKLFRGLGFKAVSRSIYLVASLIALPATALIIGLDVVLRYFFNAPLRWSIEANSLLLVLVVFGTLPYVWEERRHIKMKLIYNQLGRRGKAVADAIAALCGLAVAAPLCYKAGEYINEFIQYREAAEYLQIPFWPFAAFITTIAAMMCIQFIAFLWGSLRNLWVDND